ncbi:hypothetical protein RDI58_027744 [Solanum bulbocastanum]|uniref:Uncharacterized protein n=1 Tax=Solanum bulbocastanum TaxID=147425 RepID=A0AAN8Y4M0_SOLBU
MQKYVDFEGRVRQVWSIHCPQEVLLSELRSAVISKSSRWGYTADTISCFQCKPLL